MRVVDHDQGVVFFSQRADLIELGVVAVHREDAVGRNHPEAGALGFLQLLLQLGHVAVAVSCALCLAQADSVDDAGVVQFIRDNAVFLGQQRFEQASIGVEA